MVIAIFSISFGLCNTAAKITRESNPPDNPNLIRTSSISSKEIVDCTNFVAASLMASL